MAEYIEREAAKDAVCKAFVRWGSEDQYHESTHQIDRIPAADVVSVVRCKDCDSYNKGEGLCEAFEFYQEENGYCSYGERKNGEKGGKGGAEEKV